AVARRPPTTTAARSASRRRAPPPATPRKAWTRATVGWMSGVLDVLRCTAPRRPQPSPGSALEGRRDHREAGGSQSHRTSARRRCIGDRTSVHALAVRGNGLCHPHREGTVPHILRPPCLPPSATRCP